jgi:putrescine transport system substrate-binding protein
VLALAAGTGCAPGTGTVPGTPGDPASAERVLNVYNWGLYIDPAVVEDFEREFGIKVNYDVYDSNEILETRLFVGHTHYDVVVPSGYFVERQIRAGIYRKLDRDALPNLKNLDPEVVRAVAVYDPGNEYAVDYMWLSTTGIAYNVRQIRARMADAPVDSWRMLFDARVLAHFADCGVATLDSPVNVFAAALIYLGRDPNSESPADLRAAETLLHSVRRYLRYMDSNRIGSDLANGDICLALTWSGDVPWARESASGAANGVQLEFSIPKEGSVSNLDVLAIPADAPHPHNAHLFINYLLRPEVAARNTTAIKYANGVNSSLPLLSAALRDDRTIYPSAAERARLVPSRARSHEATRRLMRAWTRVKSES